MSVDPTVVVAPNNPAGRDSKPPLVGLNRDGKPYRWRMFFDGYSRVADSDSLRSLAQFIVGLDPNDGWDEDLFVDRALDYVKNKVFHLRAVIRANIPDEEWDALEDYEREWLTWTDPADPDFVYPSDVGDDDPAPVIWNHDVPLVLCALDYQVSGDAGGPSAPLSSQGQYPDEGNIIWLDPSSPSAFLQSLRKPGIIDLYDNSQWFVLSPDFRREDIGKASINSFPAPNLRAGTEVE